MSWAWPAFVAFCAVAATLAVVFSWSRGAWLGFLAGAGVLALFSVRRLALGLAVGAVAAAVMGGGLWLGVLALWQPCWSGMIAYLMLNGLWGTLGHFGMELLPGGTSLLTGGATTPTITGIRTALPVLYEPLGPLGQPIVPSRALGHHRLEGRCVLLVVLAFGVGAGLRRTAANGVVLARRAL
jgi:hypothetical protein